MKKFSVKILFFLLPFILLYGFYYFFYDRNNGDLMRMGNFMQVDYSYRGRIAKIENDFLTNKYSNKNLINKHQKKITYFFGDSFIGSTKNHFNNIYQRISGDSVVTFRANSNPIFGVLELLTSDSISHIQIDRITLELVERSLLDRLKLVANNKNEDVYLENNRLTNEQLNFENNNNIKFPSKDILTFANNSYRFHLGYNDFGNTQRVSLNRSLFSHKLNSELLFYKQDLSIINESEFQHFDSLFDSVFDNIFRLCQRYDIDFKLIVAPNKLSIYQDYIAEKNYDNSILSTCKLLVTKNSKPYYVDAFSELHQLAEIGKKDLYYFDDTHWSGIGSYYIASLLFNSYNFTNN